VTVQEKGDNATSFPFVGSRCKQTPTFNTQKARSYCGVAVALGGEAIPVALTGALVDPFVGDDVAFGN